MRILQVSTTAPEKIFSNEELIRSFPCELPEAVKSNIANSGVAQRHLVQHTESAGKKKRVTDESELTELCIDACRTAVQDSAISLSDVGYFVMSYDASPFLCPGFGQVLLRKLGLTPFVECVNAQGLACAAFSKSLNLAGNYLAAHPSKHVLLCISGVNSFWFNSQVRGLNQVKGIHEINQIKNRTQRTFELQKWVATLEYFLFGDGVAAAIIGKQGSGLAVRKICEITNLRRTDYLAGYARLTQLETPYALGFCSYLDKSIPNLGVKYTTVALKRLLRRRRETLMKESKFWALHTGSEKILDLLAEKHGIQREKIRQSYEVLREYGNLAGGSLPFILERILQRNKLAENDSIIMLGYGWGFSTSAALLEYQ